MAQLEQFGWHLLTNYVERNADCHAKNIALYYTGLKDVACTPVYDLVTTQAYPRYAANPPGLPVDGHQAWAVGEWRRCAFRKYWQDQAGWTRPLLARIFRRQSGQRAARR